MIYVLWVNQRNIINQKIKKLKDKIINTYLWTNNKLKKWIDINITERHIIL
jgi:hypothetical protein